MFLKMFSVSGFSIRPNACKKIVIRQTLGRLQLLQLSNLVPRAKVRAWVRGWATSTKSKCGIQNVDLYIAFIDLKKAFDSVDRRPTLWKVLSKIGCPENFINLVRLLQ